ncbi:succinyl-diaminopimelate desuccinylase, partial [Halorubrum sp. C3]
VRESLAGGAGDGSDGREGRAGVDAAVTLTDRESPFLEAFATDPDHELVRAVAGAAREAGDAVGLPSERGGDARPFGAATEASYFAPAPTVVFGPGDLADEAGAVAHAEREYVRVREVRAAAAAVERTVASLLGDV